MGEHKNTSSTRRQFEVMLQEGGPTEALGRTHGHGAGGAAWGKEIFHPILLNFQKKKKKASCTNPGELGKRGGNQRMKPLGVAKLRRGP